MSDYIAILTRLNEIIKIRDLYPYCQYFIVKELIKRNYKILILNYTRKLRKPYYIDDNVVVVTIPYAKSLFALSSSLIAFLISVLKKARVLYVESWPLRNIYGLLNVILLAKKYDIKIISDLYDLYFIYEADIMDEKIKKYDHLYRFYGKLWKQIYDSIDFFFLVSEEALKVAKAVFNIDQTKVKILFYGTDTSVFNYRNYHIQVHEPTTICWIGNNATKKQVHIALSSIFRELNNKVKFILGGRIDEILINSLKKKSRYLTYLGKIPYETSARIYAEECDIVIAPTDPTKLHNKISIYEKPIQALLLGKPTVFTLGLATYKYLYEKLGIKPYNGYVVVKNNLHYGRIIRYIIDNYEHMVSKARNAADQIMSKVSRQNICENKIKIILNIM